MGTIADKLLYLDETKTKLREAINASGGTLAAGDPFRAYAAELYDKIVIPKLFANGEQGAWYDPSDLSTLFQDSAGTVPVTVAGDPVGRMLDKSGRGNRAIQPVSTRRPAYTADSASLFDGVDDALIVLDNAAASTPYASIGNYCSGFFAVRFHAFRSPVTAPNWVISSVIHEIRNTGSSNVKIPFSFGLNGSRIGFGCTSDYVSTGAFSRRSGPTDVVLNQPYVIGFVANGDSVTLYRNGVIDGVFTGLGTASRSPSDGTGLVSSRIGARTTDANGIADNFSGHIAGAVIAGYALTAAQVENVTAYLAIKAGITL